MSTVGATAPSQNTINYDALLSTTLNAYRRTMVDNIFKANAFLAALRAYDGVDYQDGGERIQHLLMYEKNTAKSYEGYEQIPVIPRDGMTSAFYEWREVADTISISRREERQNSGEAAIVRLFDQKVRQSEMSLKEAVNTQLVQGEVSANTFVPGNSAKDLNPLGYFLRKAIATDPTAGGNAGNIASATYDWWRARTAVGDSATKDTGNAFAKSISNFATLKIALRSMYNWCSRGADGSGPNVVLMNQGTYEVYEGALDAGTRYTDTQMADMGFDNVKLKGATVIWDELVPNIDEGYAADNASYSTNNKEGTAFFLNTKFYKLTIDKQTDFVTTPFVTPENQTARVAKVLFMGNACVNNYRKHGVLYAISNTLTS